jgi:hypothetical protein
VISQPRTTGEGDIGSMAAFSLLFVIPAALGAGLWIVLRLLDAIVGLGSIAPAPWLIVVLAPAILSAAIARSTCRRSDTPAWTAWGFAVGAAAITVLFTVVAAAWLVPMGE